MKPKRFLYITFIVLLSGFSMTSLLYAYPYGRTGRSGKQGATCNVCHFGTETPDLSLSGPYTILAGETVDFSFIVDRNSDTATVNTAGFNLAVEAGTLLGKDETPEVCRDPADGPPTHTNKTCITVVDGLNEIAHARPAVLVDGKATFNLRYTAPITPGIIKFYGAGVAAVEGAGAHNNQVHVSSEVFQIRIVTSHDVYLPLIIR